MIDADIDAIRDLRSFLSMVVDRDLSRNYEDLDMPKVGIGDLDETLVYLAATMYEDRAVKHRVTLACDAAIDFANIVIGSDQRGFTEFATQLLAPAGVFTTIDRLRPFWDDSNRNIRAKSDAAQAAIRERIRVPRPF